jgi:hypothetical protein
MQRTIDSLEEVGDDGVRGGHGCLGGRLSVDVGPEFRVGSGTQEARNDVLSAEPHRVVQRRLPELRNMGKGRE